MVTEKTCTKCGEVKELTKFNKSREIKSGYISICKECRSKAFKARKESLGFKATQMENKLAIEKLGEKFCIGLKRVMPLSEFTRDKNSLDAYAPSCKKYKNDMDKSYKKAQRASPEFKAKQDVSRIHIEKVGFKLCKGYNKVMPLSAFGKDKNTYDTYKPSCREYLNSNRFTSTKVLRESKAWLDTQMENKLAIEAIGEKFCIGLQKMMPLSEFNKDKTRPDAYAPACKAFRSVQRSTPEYKETRDARRATPEGKLSSLIRGNFKRVLDSVKANRPGHTFDLVGYTKEEALDHFNSGIYTWKNYEEGDYHMDHIIPVAYFVKKISESGLEADGELNEEGMRLLKNCNSLPNLRIWPATDNEAKRDTIYMDLIKEHNIEHLLD